ncbi:sulfatase [Maribacter sp. 2307ULW6-5]|uniref:sulfatase family protein n=1 Tax=Maribacter sp. 2307ULW6-5 TaxID=3386275 RepID=UPI0039BD442F
MKIFGMLSQTKKTLVLLSLFISGCNMEAKKEGIPLAGEVTPLVQRPNILWLVTEDMGPYIPPFGDSTIVTPNLSRLAGEGVVYPHFFSTSGVCAPSRAAIATGMYPSGIGANHMRTTSYTEVTGLPKYGAVPPPEVRMVSELLRAEGYYCTNNYKTDYQFKAPMTAWDDNGPYAHWRNREAGKPFFSVMNFTETHESGLFEPYGHRYVEQRHYQSGNRDFKWKSDRMPEDGTPKHLPKDATFNIPPYLPDTEVVRRDMWKMYNNIAEMDRQVGAVLKQLEEDGLLESTIIFFYGDHGGPLPRQKRLIYDSGLNTPLIVRFPQGKDAGKRDPRLLSFVDLAPTILSLTGFTPPKYMQGQAFLGPHAAQESRKYIHAAADRFDGFTDAIRAVRDQRFKYIRNYRPDQGYYLPIEYRERIPTMQELLRLRSEGKLNKVQMQWFRDKKDPVELFDCVADPHELNNLAGRPEHAQKLRELENELDRWLAAIGDRPNLPEGDLLNDLWGGATTQPVTKNPTISLSNGSVVLACATPGASIGYRIIPANGTAPEAWTVYRSAFELPEGARLEVQAHRIGFVASEVVSPQ